MKSNKSLAILAVAGAMAIGCGSADSADKKPGVDLGKYEYMNSCAACHGADGKGAGPAADALKRVMPDLTTLAKRNNGVLPVDQLYRWIDGRDAIKEHGDRAMPMWGWRYSAESAELAEFFFDHPRGTLVEFDMYVRNRILALVDYLNRIQTK